MRTKPVTNRWAATAIVLWFGLFVPLLAPPAAAGDVARVKGTSVWIEHPAGFVAAHRFPGFQHEASQTSIMVSVVPAPLSETSKGMTKEGLAKNGMTLLAQSAEAVNGAAARLLHVEQTANGTVFEKWLVVAGDERATVLVVATTPKPADERLRAALKRAILAATWDSAAPVDLFEGLPFRAKPAGTMTDVKRMANNILFAEPDPPKAGVPPGPVCVVGLSLGPMAISHLAAFSKSRAEQTATIKDVGSVRGREMKVTGRDAYELLADAKDFKTSAPLLLYQVVVPDGSGYCLVQGIVGAERAEECLASFRRITESIERRDDAARPSPKGERRPEPKPAPEEKPAPGGGK